MSVRLLYLNAVLFGPLLLGLDDNGTPRPPVRSVSPSVRADVLVSKKALLDQYCVGCHNDKAKVANFSLQNADLSGVGDHPEKWEKVIRKLRAGMMPPPGMRRPPEAEYNAMRDW